MQGIAVVEIIGVGGGLGIFNCLKEEEGGRSKRGNQSHVSGGRTVLKAPPHHPAGVLQCTVTVCPSSN